MSAATDKLDALVERIARRGAAIISEFLFNDELELTGLKLINESAYIADIKVEEVARKHGY
jgi:hypothetical protein